MVLFFWSHNWYVRVWQSREEACIRTNNYYTTRMYRGGCKKAQVVRRALTKRSSRQMFVVYCITSSKLTRHVSNKPQKQLQITVSCSQCYNRKNTTKGKSYYPFCTCVGSQGQKHSIYHQMVNQNKSIFVFKRIQKL